MKQTDMALIRQAFEAWAHDAWGRRPVPDNAWLGWLACALNQSYAGWQPIETAPKDGSAILLGAPGRSTQGCWMTPSDKPVIKYSDGFAPEEEWEEYEPFWASYDGGFTDEHPPTHWMPLPAAPAIAKEDQK